MVKKKKILLIQIRPQEQIIKHEYECFKKGLGNKVILDSLNLISQELDIDKVLFRYNGIIIGGGSYSCQDNFEQKDKI